MKRFQSTHLLIVATSVFLICIIFQTAHAATLYVGDGESYATIQSAINAASNGDTIIVRDGTYNEDVAVSKRLIIQSENGYASTKVGGFYISSDFVKIIGFDVCCRGIRLRNADNCTISKNQCGVSSSKYNDIGIDVDYLSDNNIISGNICNYSWNRGIFIAGSGNYCLDNICNSSRLAGISVETGDN